MDAIRSRPGALSKERKAFLVGAEGRELAKGRELVNPHLLALDRHDAALTQAPQNAVCMDDIQADEVGELLLRDRKSEVVPIDKPSLRELPVDFYEYERNPLLGAAPANNDQARLKRALLDECKLRQPPTKLRQPSKDVAHQARIKDAEGDVACSLDGVQRPIEKEAIQADGVAGEHDLDDLSSPIGQQSMTQSPAAEQRVEVSIHFTASDEGIASRRVPVGNFEPHHRFELFGAEILER
jgi:hypothetical protein